MVAKTPSKISLLERLVSDGLVEARDLAEKQVRAGLVRVDGVVVDKPGTLINQKSQITVTPRKDFVGRGAHKLLGALDSFAVSPDRVVCADVGACTGGFTEVLLMRGATRVYAIDVGYGDLDWKIRSDSRVVVMERTNVRYVEALPEPIDLVTIDVSFISLTKVLPVVCKWLAPQGRVIALIKPQFEAAREDVGVGGIVDNPEVHQGVIDRVSEILPSLGMVKRAVTTSPIRGAEGNLEFFILTERE